MRVAIALTIGSLWAASLCGELFLVRWPLLLCAAVAFVPYSFLMVRERSLSTSLRSLLFCVCLVGLPLTVCSALLSDDVYRHLFEGRVVLAGGNPFSTPPLDPSLAALRDDAWSQINHKSVATIYPVLLQGLFALLSFGKSVFAFKAFALCVHLLTTRLLFVRSSVRAAWLFGLNPLLLIEGPLSGHHDGVLGLLMLLAVLGLQGARQQGIVFATLAASLKLVGLVALATFFPRRRLLVVIATLASIAMLVPGVLLVGEGVSGTTHFAHRWRGNDGAFAVVERGVAHVATTAGVRRHVRLDVPDAFPELIDPTATFEGVYRGAIRRADLVHFAARAVVLLIVFAFALGMGRRFAPGRALLAVLWLALLLSPQLHPWYWMWLIPLACHLSRPGTLVAAPLLLATYASHDGWRLARVHPEPNWWIHLPLWLIFAVEMGLFSWVRKRLTRDP